jgi:ATP-binding cassette subfamily B protein
MKLTHGRGALGDAVRGSRALFALSWGSVMAAAFLSLLDPIVIQITLDSTLGHKPLAEPAWFEAIMAPLGGTKRMAGSLAFCALLILGLNLGQGLFLFLKGYLSSLAAERSAQRLRERLYGHLSDLPYSYFSKADSGDLLQRCTSDVDTVRRFLEGQIVEVARALLLLSFSVGIMASLNLKLTMVSVILVPPIFLWSYFFFKRVQKGFKASDEAESSLSSVILENLRGIRVVRAFGRESYEERRFEAHNRAYTGATQRVIDDMGTYWSVSAGLSTAQGAITLLVGGYWAARGEMTLGGVVMFFAYVGRFLWPVRQMGRTLTEFGKTIVSLRRIGRILQERSEYEGDGSVEARLRGEVEFRHVSFEYEPGKRALSDVSFTARPGETVAILGKTGAGKSSLMHLIPRLIEASDGSVLLDGIDSRHLSKRCIRSQVGLVLQEPFMFSKSLKDNIELGCQGASAAEIERAARSAALHTVVEDLEGGWETAVGEEGVTLSGGQRQRAAIARVLLRKPRILIFDDSLSAVDTETDAFIRRELERRRGDMTMLVVAHRVTTLAGADRILVMEDGRIVEQGRHAELIAKPGLYRSIWEIQSGGRDL